MRRIALRLVRIGAVTALVAVAAVSAGGFWLLGWIPREHRFGSVRVQVYGPRWPGGAGIAADSLRVELPEISVVVRALEAQAALVREGWRLRPDSASVRARSVDIALLPAPPGSGPADTSASAPPAFPADIRLPASLRIELDSLRLARRDSLGRPTGLFAVAALRLANGGPARLELSARGMRPAGRGESASLAASADWASGDSLALSVRVALHPSDTAPADTARAAAVLVAADLTRGRGDLSVGIASPAAWAGISPALAQLPLLGGVELRAHGRRDQGGDSAAIEARLATIALAGGLVPAIRWKIGGGWLDGRIALSVEGAGSGGERFDLDLRTGAPLVDPRRIPAATGTLVVERYGMAIAGHRFPLSGRGRIERLDASGVQGVVELESGSRIRAQASFHPFHWSGEADIAGREPWAVDWVPGLAMGRGRVLGRDSAGGARFLAVVDSVRLGPVRAGQLSSVVWLGSENVEFPRGTIVDSSAVWSWDGIVDWKRSFLRFGLAPASGLPEGGRAALSMRFGDTVRVALDDLPLNHLPLSIARARQPFEVRGTGEYRFVHDSLEPLQAVSLVLRARPAVDSLVLRVSGQQRGERVVVDTLVARLAGDSAIARLGATRLPDTAALVPWRIDSAFLRVPGFHAGRIRQFDEKIPRFEGVLRGEGALGPAGGVDANFRIDRPMLLGDDGQPQALPNLLIWSAGDTLSAGASLPLRGELVPVKIRLFDLRTPHPGFDFVAFAGDVLKLSGRGRIEEWRRASADVSLVGFAHIPGTQLDLRDLRVHGRVAAEAAAEDGRGKGFSWQFEAKGDTGKLVTPNDSFPLRLSVVGNPGAIALERMLLGSPPRNFAEVHALWRPEDRSYRLDGQARDFRINLGNGWRAAVAQLDVRAASDSDLVAQLRKGRVFKRYSGRQVLDLTLAEADLHYQILHASRRLQGTILVDTAYYSRNHGDFSQAFSVFGASSAESEKPLFGASEKPLLLDLAVTTDGSSLRIANNLANATLSGDISIRGPASRPLLRGGITADQGTFGYLDRDFQIGDLHVTWSAAPLSGGEYRLDARRDVRASCEDSLDTQEAADMCEITVASAGTLSNPVLTPPTSSCDEAASTAEILKALAFDCYNREENAGMFAGVNRGVLLAPLRTLVINKLLNKELQDGRWGRQKPVDSILIGELPGERKNEVSVTMIKRLTDQLETELEFHHAFDRPENRGAAAAEPMDDYVLRLRYNIPFDWIPEPEIRERLHNRLVAELETDRVEDPQKKQQVIVKPLLRYRWTFW